jgi:hypothetical protein
MQYKINTYPDNIYAYISVFDLGTPTSASAKIQSTKYKAQ